ncbi:DUF3558 family protein [Amycolatopsis rhabdoformis]|uniref:DUF3558 family protein n=1 Tax=Amycolatopsis rhabdoformis TaxID=1448059 RepID=A0ABZ1IKT9_9PSEU|nr:DUF3558 family protein [Amycolatopsis rhabdoformis]WSE34386.1 DUF3558 family protein [Amycolatopsis rhabdoformis]
MAEPVRKVLLVVPLFLVLVACGRPVTPKAIAGDGGPQPSAPGSSAAPTTLAGLDPCALLSPSDRSSAGLTELGKPKTIGAARACDWTVPSTFGVTVTLDETAGLANLDVSRGTRVKKKVGAHQALQVSDKKSASGTCAVLLGIGDSASVQVDVSNASFSDTTLACSRAATVAGLVEPKLP